MDEDYIITTQAELDRAMDSLKELRNNIDSLCTEMQLMNAGLRYASRIFAARTKQIRMRLCWSIWIILMLSAVYSVFV